MRSAALALAAFAALAAGTAGHSAEATYYQCSVDLNDMPKGAPRFADYAVPVAKIDRPAPVKLRTAFDRAFRTRLRQAGKGPPNFAGHYTINVWGCGTGCATYAGVDLLTGAVAIVGGSVGDTPMERVQSRPDSRLLIVTAKPSEDSPEVEAVRYFVWTGKALKLVKTYPYNSVCRPDPIEAN
ncbi:MAG: hypothetical protein EPO51_15155 [Phenylobacterium sp.]|uniref:hypothetical protein n=1 Tax=Phenylobacterium sp. TaxID=1871053 RepID=UPI0011FA0CCE|nr:hypothetical protein [Phenylobacterium sp.]TAJ71112.1 MAG: hypothetical protein EPO51_15155 [Phenylobacterium sp.]